MKRIWFKTLCLGSTLTISMMPLISCGKAEKQINVKTKITSPFFAALEDVTFGKQITNEKLWKQFVHVFKTHEDTLVGDDKPNWRGEFWGKMMRGAVFCYKYTHDEALYNILAKTVNDLLETQDTDGRISTYAQEKEFKSWDMWGRKYVMTALLHFYEICKDETFKQEIINALEKHADYILEKIGNGPNQIDITNTGYEQWKGLNSCTILEPMVHLYEVTKEKRYLDFATYIIKTGGVNEGNMIDEAKDNHDPWLFPVRKAYESMSFFEGVYRYGKVVNNKNLKTAALNYFNKVYEQEITVIGSGGYEEEQWHNGVVNQTTSHTGQAHPLRWGQETCVTVTWMRILNILYEETHDIKYYERFANSAMNGFLGTLNSYDQPIAGVDDVTMPFDTYSPLCNEPRGINGGGVVTFLDPEDQALKTYGCCQCNAPVSVGLMGLNYCRPLNGKLYLNEYFSGNVTNQEEGVNITITNTSADTSYESDGNAVVTINSTSNQELMLRIPSWANEPVVKINNVTKKVKVGSYFNAGALKNINKIEVEFNPKIKLNKINEKVYFTYGTYVLAFDEYQNQWLHEHLGEFGMQIRDLKIDEMQQMQAIDDEFVRFEAPFTFNGVSGTLTLTNYSSAGKHAYYIPEPEDPNYCMVNVFFRNDY